MKRFIAPLLISISLVVTWFVTAIAMPVTPQMYLALTAPWWHVALHVLWALAVLLTSMQGVALLYEGQSRRKHLAQQPPQNT